MLQRQPSTATTTTTTVPGEADVVFQQSSIYYNPSEEGGETVKRKVCLDNPDDLVGGIQFDECEYNVNGSSGRLYGVH